MTSTSFSLFGGLARLAVERIHGQARLPVHAVRGLDHVVLHVAADAVLGPEEGRQADLRVGMDEVGGVAQGMVDRRLVADEPDPRIAQQVEPLVEQPLESEHDVGGRPSRRCHRPSAEALFAFSRASRAS